MNANKFEIDSQTGLLIKSLDVYYAGRVAHGLDEVREVYSRIRKMGHSITYAWAEIPTVKKPYSDFAEENKPIAEAMLKGAFEADVLILVDDPNLRGALDEHGAFLTSTLYRPEGKICYMVPGIEGRGRGSIFDTLDVVREKENLEEVYKELGRIASLANLG